MNRVVWAMCALVLVSACKKEEPTVEAPPPAPPAEEKPAEPAAAPSPAAAEPAAPAAPADNAALFKMIAADLNAGRIDEALVHWADDAEETVVSSPQVPPVQGKAAFKDMFGQLRTAFPDGKHGIRRLFDAGNQVVLQMAFTATHTGPFMGVPASNKPVGYEAVRFITLENGKLKKIVTYANMSALMAQMGAIPDMPAPPVPTAPTEPEVIKAEAMPANVETAKAVYAAMGTPDMKAFVDSMTADSVYHDTVMGMDHRGPEAGKKSMDEFKKAFPDLKAEIEEIVSVGPWLLVRNVMTGTHKGELAGGPKPIAATGKTVTLHGADILFIENGKMKEGWGYGDPAEMMLALGLMPPPPVPGTAPGMAPGTAPAPAPVPGTAPAPK